MLVKPGAVPGFEGDLQGLPHGEVAEQPGRLERAAETLPGAPGGGETGDVGSEDLDPTAGGYEPADGVHQRGLAGAVRADEPDDLVRRRPGWSTPSTARRPPNCTVTSVVRNTSAGNDSAVARTRRARGTAVDLGASTVSGRRRSSQANSMSRAE